MADFADEEDEELKQFTDKVRLWGYHPV